MTGAEAQRRSWAALAWVPSAQTVWPVFITVGVLALFLVAKLALILLVESIAPLQGYLIVFGVSTLAAFAGRNAHINHSSEIFARLSGATALGLAFYLLVEPTVYLAAQPDTRLVSAMLRVGDFAAFAAAVAGIRRPTFLIMPAVHVITARLLVDDVSGLPMGKHDILYLAEAGIFIALGSVVSRSLARARLELEPDVHRNLTHCFAFVAIGFHLANYFWSGIGKVILDGRPFEWLLANDVSNFLVVGIEKGIAPLGSVPALAQTVHDALSSGSLFFNGFVLTIQLLAIVSIARLMWLRVGAICYDLLHVGVYVFGGVLFWPWIWMNGAVLWAIRGENDRSVGISPKICCAICILVCGLPVLGAASWLAWYDVADTRISNVEAQTATSANWTPVPLSFFGAHSYSVSHGYLDRGHRAGHFDPSVPGLAYNSARRRADGSCAVPQVEDRPESEQAQVERLMYFDSFMRARHQAAKQEAKWFGKYAYYLRLHHHPSNPMLYSNFHALALDDIVRYRLVTRSVCLALKDGHVTRRILKEDAHVVEIY
ncbi:hypothetical protein [Microvirga arabica]|uniref:hypothetical protein n=1 Tax=Microvirga arabica TaxID=1128671 RepID=UPI00193A6741|nr:hypothetical protein [Microvirga arabica]MBM1172032.1 hypothetical protein [Microvirga arabica]